MIASSARFALDKQMIFTATGASFLSATLLFSIQPMFTKMVLPVLGGSAATWSIAMVFFQAVLLIGYAYAHVLTRYVPFYLGAAIHIVLLIAAFVTLPVEFQTAHASEAPTHPAVWILSTFTVALGLPFFALSAHGPLLQAWFAKSQHARAQNPYFLYIASNIGSFAALLAYPFLIEPFIGLKMQSQLWTYGFFVLTVLVAATIACVKPSTSAPEHSLGGGRVTPPQMLRWMALGFIPSALLVSVTSHISTDVAAAPLLWVVPLALYLLSFTVAFRSTLPIIKVSELQIIIVWGVTGLLVNMSIGQLPLGIALPVHLGLFSAIAIFCHHMLYQLRPSTHQLTLFYVCMSLGGILGGSFCGVVAPLIFTKITEYPLLLLATVAIIPGAMSSLHQLDTRREILRPCLILLAAFAISIASSLIANDRNVGQIFISLVVGLLALSCWRKPAGVLTALVLGFVSTQSHDMLLSKQESFRSFFGVTNILTASDGKFRLMVHGTTIHGAMRIRNGDGSPFTERPVPTSYYSYEGPLGEAIKSQRLRLGQINHAALIGLGTGALACHFAPSENTIFYELDPVIVRLAQDRSKFRFLADCDVQPQIIIGDARLTLAKQSPRSDIIVVDAFSSDAIPVHLLTLEAIDLYLSKLAPRGVIALHISNVYFDLNDVLARAAASRQLHGITKTHRIKPGANEMDTPSRVAVLARNADDLEDLRKAGDWQPLPAARRAAPWSDDYSTILEPLIDMWRQN